jgi:hypothetical protein
MNFSPGQAKESLQHLKIQNQIRGTAILLPPPPN